jgi:propanol-preferring alcohol dehydrogenase
MRAWVVGEPGPVERRPMQWIERDAPVPGPDEVRVQVRACGVCRTDLHVVEGDLPLRRRPIVPGHQVAGRIDRVGAAVTGLRIGDRVGAGWLHATCGSCRFCRSARENLCEAARFTGWSEDGGYAEQIVVPAAFVHPLPEEFDDLRAAPLLCAGIIGYRALRQIEPERFPSVLAGMRLGIYGFGAAGHVCLQVARALGAEVHVRTRDRARHQTLAEQLGAASVGDAAAAVPVPLDAILLFAPAGELVPPALRALDRGGRLVLGGIHMTPIPELRYELLYGERVVRSVMNHTRADAREFLALAARIPIRPEVQAFPLARADEALLALKRDGVRGAAVLVAPGDG